MDADAQGQTAGSICVLDRLCAAYCLDRAGELDQEAVTHRLEQSPGVLGDLGFDDLYP
jgi:hypothetical protein